MHFYGTAPTTSIELISRPSSVDEVGLCTYLRFLYNNVKFKDKSRMIKSFVIQKLEWLYQLYPLLEVSSIPMRMLLPYLASIQN